MDLINGMIHVFTPSNLLYCFLGCFLGTLVGVLPGLGPGATLAILLPLTMFLEPTGSIIMLCGIFYGVNYGGSTTSILVNIPGEPSSMVSCFDGFPMTQQGRAGEALWIAAVASFIAGTLGTIALSFIGPNIAIHALKFGPPEYFGLIFFSLTAIIGLSGSSLTKGLGAGLVGLLLSAVGLDPVTGIPRLNFGSITLTRGFEIVPLMVGLFGIGEILSSTKAGVGKIYEGKLGKMMPRGKELKKGLWAALRGTSIGFFPAMIPGMVASILSFIAYDIEKRVSKYPEKFGTGVIEGVASPEACNNAAVQGYFVPLFTLGIPASASCAIILAALVMYGLQPGPTLFIRNKEFVWTIIASMYIGNVMLLILNLPLVGFWARISLIPFKYLGPIVLGICIVGAYSSRSIMFDIWFVLGAGILGYIMREKHWPLAPLILGFILGPTFEQSFRTSMAMGGPLIFFRHLVPTAFIIAAIILTIISLKYLRHKSKGSS